MNTNIHYINLPKIVQIGWGHHVDFCVWKNRPLFWRRVYMDLLEDHYSILSWWSSILVIFIKNNTILPTRPDPIANNK